MPHTQRGVASAYGSAPWHLSGRVFTVWYHLAEPEEARRHIAPPLEVPENPLCRARFYELNMDAGHGDSLVVTNPEQSQFFEAVIAIECHYQGIQGDYSVHMYSDNATYIAWSREVIGWPLKAGKVSITKPWKSHQLESGVEIKGSLERFGNNIMSAQVTLTEPKSSQSIELPNWFTYKIIPSIEQNKLDVHQLIMAGPSRIEAEIVWNATGTLDLPDSTHDELHHLRPGNIVAADYVPFIDLTVGYGKVLERMQ